VNDTPLAVGCQAGGQEVYGSCHADAVGLGVPLTLANGVQSGENGWRRTARFLVRGYRGLAVGVKKGYRFRWFVLTESDEAIEAGIVFGHEFHRFVRWLRYWCPDVQYLVVEHRQGDKQRRNWHVITYGSDKLPVLAIRAYWQKHFLSSVRGMSEIRNPESAVRYCCKYLGSAGYVRSWSSQGWVFPGWVGWSKWYRKNFSPTGEYPSAEAIAHLSLMSPDEREAVTLQSLMRAGRRGGGLPARLVRPECSVSGEAAVGELVRPDLWSVLERSCQDP
jgi:hypothetical protein